MKMFWEKKLKNSQGHEHVQGGKFFRIFKKNPKAGPVALHEQFLGKKKKENRNSQLRPAMNDAFWGTTEKKEIPGAMNGVLGKETKKKGKEKFSANL